MAAALAGATRPTESEDHPALQVAFGGYDVAVFFMAGPMGPRGAVARGGRGRWPVHGSERRGHAHGRRGVFERCAARGDARLPARRARALAACRSARSIITTCVRRARCSTTCARSIATSSGSRVGPRPPFRRFGYWLYAGERPVLHLGEADAGESCDAPVSGTFNHASFDCTGKRQFEARLAGLGIEYRTAQVPLTGQAQLFFRDPAGNGVELAVRERRGRRCAERAAGARSMSRRERIRRGARLRRDARCGARARRSRRRAADTPGPVDRAGECRPRVERGATGDVLNAFSPDGRYVAIHDSRRVRVVEARSGKPVRDFRLDPSSVKPFSLAVSSSGNVALGLMGNAEVFEAGKDWSAIGATAPAVRSRPSRSRRTSDSSHSKARAGCPTGAAGSAVS